MSVGNGRMLTIGRSDGTGALTANAYSWNNAVTFQTGTGGIHLNGAQTMGGHSFFARTHGASDIVIGASGGVSSTAAGTAFMLVSGRNFHNSGGGVALSAPSGRWLVYSTDPAQNTLGGISASFEIFSCSYGGTCGAIPGTGNGLLYSAASAGNGGGGGGGSGGNGNDELSTLETEVREMVKKGIIGRILRRTIEIMYCRDYDPTSCKPL